MLRYQQKESATPALLTTLLADGRPHCAETTKQTTSQCHGFAPSLSIQIWGYMAKSNVKMLQSQRNVILKGTRRCQHGGVPNLLGVGLCVKLNRMDIRFA